MKFNQPKSACAMALLLTVCGCVDDSYDLSDIDTTVRVPVDNLVVPVNIDRINLKSIINVDEDDPANSLKIIDNEYVYVKEGDFTSGGVKVDPVNIASPTVSPVEVTISVPPALSGLSLPATTFTVDVPANATTFSFNSGSISKDIYDIKRIYGRMIVDLLLDITGATDFIDKYDIDDLRIQLPKALAIATQQGLDYDPETGIVKITRKGINGRLSVPLEAEYINTDNSFDAVSHSLTVDGKVGMIDGKLTITTKDQASISQQLGIRLTASFSGMTADGFDGTIQYDIDNVNVPDIVISDLPDVLSQSGTNLLLKRPTLYLSLNNPMSVCGLSARSGFVIKSVHSGESRSYAIDNQYFEISSAPTGNYCFSPEQPSKTDSEYTPCTFVPYSDLGAVLSGDGLPERLQVELPGLNIPRQDVQGFMLGHDYGDINGKYKFVAPLQFEEGASIVYSDKIDGWGSEDLDALTVTSLDISFKVSTNLPVGVRFTGYPIDSEGRRIGNVSIIGADIDANASSQEVHVRATGEFCGLDGVEFHAVADAVDGPALSPDMHISLTDIRPCVAGYYQKEL